MDHKAWLWRKKSMEKTIAPNDLTGYLIHGDEEQQVQVVLIDKAEHEKEVRHLTEKLVSVIAECNLKDNLARKHEKMAQEAASGMERAEAEVASLKQQLDESLEMKMAGEERIVQLETALKECKQQLRFVREEQERRVHGAVSKGIREFEKSHVALEQRLEETTKRLAKMSVENAHLSKSVLSKEKLIEDLTEQMKQAEADANLFTARFDSMEKNNSSLKYEVRILEKELEIRNEEREFNQRSADASHKQHLESVKKIAKLEAECQRLRLLVRKRLPGPAAVAQMKNEVEILGRDSTGRRRTNAFSVPMIDSGADKYLETPTKKINFLTEQLVALQEDNKALKEALYKKVNELQASKMKNGRTRSTSSRIELMEGSPKTPKNMELAPKLDASFDHSLGSVSDMDSEISIKSSESWASALISELENVRGVKKKESVSCKPVGVSDITLMDDFVEMEKLATVSADESSEIFCSPPDAASAKQHWNDVPLIAKGTDKDKSGITKSISKLIELVESIHQSSENASLKADERLHNKNMEGSMEYVVRVFQWKSSARSAVLQGLLHTCYDCLNEKVDPSKLLMECVSALGWMLNHCFSLKDVSSMRDEILKDWDDSRCEIIAEVGITHQVSDPDKLDTSAEKCSSKATNNVVHLKELHCDMLEENKKLKDDLLSIGSAKQILEVQLQSVIGEKEALTQQIETSKQTIDSLYSELNTLKEPTVFSADHIENHKLIPHDLDRQLAEAKIELNEVRQKFASLEVELDNKHSCCEELEAVCLDLQLQLESLKKDDSCNGDFDLMKKQLQLSWEFATASEKLAECQQTILNLGKQLKGLDSSKDATLFNKILPNIPEIAPSDTEDLSKAIVLVPSKTESIRRASLLDQMMAEDSLKATNLKTSGVSSVENVLENPSKRCLPYGGSKSFKNNDKVGSLAIVPSKNHGGGRLWRKLLWRKKKTGNKIPSLPVLIT
ncbi:hypothetical protein MLD38_031428 [Melastoma candidum]|uniref:Uncharacterized protein n=1 Tax=Melastoma candidum TaxID=119954 RepID=A0ACB9MRQ7_9MYRT|nr:hypothetical protein MLD38_031428 [Melastoma candidum]